MMNEAKSARSDAPVFLTLKELAELLRVKPRTVYDWVANEKRTGIPVERAGGLLRFRLDKVLDWTEGRGKLRESA
jgi:putative molybdopterin biosynthesis protein